MIVQLAHSSQVRTGKEAVLEYCLGHRLFGVLPQSALVDLIEEIVERTYVRGHHLYHAGDPVNYVFVVRTGLLAMTGLDRQGNVYAVLTFYPGDVIGFGATFHGVLWPWTTTAVIDSTAYLVRKETFDDLYRRFPVLAHQVACELSALFRRSQETTVRFTLAPVPSRLAGFLLEMKTQVTDSCSGSPCIDLPLSHRDLALLLGTTRETVTRTFGRLCDAGLISVSGKRVLILQLDALSRLAEQW